jgi:glutaredoxin
MKRMTVLLCVAAALAVPAVQAQTTLYKWVDKDGTVQYTEFPPPKDAKNVTEKSIRGGGPGGDEQLPYATRMAAQRYPVTLYTSTDCGELCSKGRSLLSNRGVPFTEKNAQTDQDAQEALVKAAGALSVPFLVIANSANLRGFDEPAWQGALDRAGYARTRLPGQAAPRPQDQK